MAVHPLHRQGIRYDASNHQQAFSFPTPTPLNIPPLHPPFFPWPFAQSQPAAFSHVLPFLHRSPSSSIALRRHAAGRAVRAWVPQSFRHHSLFVINDFLRYVWRRLRQKQHNTGQWLPHVWCSRTCAALRGHCRGYFPSICAFVVSFAYLPSLLLTL